jgi:hypothetical protein
MGEQFFISWNGARWSLPIRDFLSALQCLQCPDGHQPKKHGDRPSQSRVTPVDVMVVPGFGPKFREILSTSRGTTITSTGVTHDCEGRSPCFFGWWPSRHWDHRNALKKSRIGSDHRAPSRFDYMFQCPRCILKASQMLWAQFEEVSGFVSKFWDDQTPLRRCVEIPYLVSEWSHDFVKMRYDPQKINGWTFTHLSVTSLPWFWVVFSGSFSTIQLTIAIWGPELGNGKIASTRSLTNIF